MVEARSVLRKANIVSLTVSWCLIRCSPSNHACLQEKTDEEKEKEAVSLQAQKVNRYSYVYSFQLRFVTSNFITI